MSMGFETPKSIVQLYRCRTGPGNSLLAVMETGFRLTTRSSVGRPTTRQVLTAQTPHTTGDVWRGDRERRAGIRECQEQVTVTVIIE